MRLPNAVWARLMKGAAENIETLRQPAVLKELQRVLRTNTFACRAIGPSFARQLGKLYLDMLNMYKAVSGLMVSAASGPGGAESSLVKHMRSVKKEALTLVSTFVSRADDLKFVATHFIPPLLDPVLGDYRAGPPEVRGGGGEGEEAEGGGKVVFTQVDHQTIDQSDHHPRSDVDDGNGAQVHRGLL